VHWATPKDLSDLESSYLDTTPRTLTRTGLASCSASVLPPRSVLFSSRAPIGLVAINRIPVATNQGFKSFVPDPTRIHAEYLLHWLRTHRPMLESLGNGATFKEVSKAVVSRVEMPLPPISEQCRIAEVLDRAETLRAQRRQALAQLDALAESIFDDLFGDELAITSRWPTRPLGELLDFLTSGSRGWAEHYASSGDLFLRIQNVVRDALVLDDVAFVCAPSTAEAKRTAVKPGDVLLSITADLGRTAVVPHDIGRAFINQHLCILRSSKVLPRFLSAYLASRHGQRQIAGRDRHAVKAGLNFDDIRSFAIPLPPSEMQRELQTRLDAVAGLKATHKNAATELDALFASLQHRAFRGEL
jgi:type I restriction enzyme, S subunit